MGSPQEVRIRATVPTRLDRALAEELHGRESRTSIAKLIKAGRVLVNGRPGKARFEVTEADVVTVDFPAPEPTELPAEDLPLDVVYEDGDLAVINKAAGMITHPAGPLRTGTLVNALLHRFGGLSGVGGGDRPGIVHRLDKGTTGLLVVARNDEAHRRLAAQLAERTLKRTYEAAVWGALRPDQFWIDEPIGRHPKDRKKMAVRSDGKEARSLVNVLYCSDLGSHAEVSLETGRTHQIRVHLQHYGHAIIGDPTYGGRRRALLAASPAVLRRADEVRGFLDRPALHARRIRFEHPRTGETMEFEAPVPADLDRIVRFLRHHGG